MILNHLSALQDIGLDVLDSSAREAEAHGLESFVGGASVVIGTSALVVILIILINL